MKDLQKAYSLALEAASLDFGAAMQGLLAGHAAIISQAKDEMTQSDMAFLMALSLTEKGKRLDGDGVMAGKIVDRLKGRSLCLTEEKFIAANQPQGDGEDQ
jgi:hypothetical protein